MKTPEYLFQLEQNLTRNADAETATQMKKYMKDLFPFYGIKSPLRGELFREHTRDNGLIPLDQREQIVKWGWNAPQREWQYITMELLGKQAKKVEEDIIGLYEFLIVSKSWWDTIDYIASNLVGVYFQKYPDRIPGQTQKWMDSGNMWLQRTCLLFQLKYRAKTDTQLLESFITKLYHSKEFFIRKAIGWSLREYSKTDPVFVQQFVKRYQLSGLSEREALKWMKNKGIIQ